MLAFADEQGFSLLVEQIDQDIDKSGCSELQTLISRNVDFWWELSTIQWSRFGVDLRLSANCALAGDSVDEFDVNNFAE